MRYDEENFWPAKISEKTVSVNSLVWLLLGMGIGAGAALLLTPANGREVRSALAHGYRRTLDGVSRSTRQLRQHGSNLISFSRRSS